MQFYYSSLLVIKQKKKNTKKTISLFNKYNNIWLFVKGVGGLGLYQLKIMMRGTTTVERKAFRWAKYDAEQNGQVSRNEKKKTF